ncbi:Uncharacterised protein [Vibrio cholerae]|nr:Uncharacterised protein [Vibrio cholerae]
MKYSNASERLNVSGIIGQPMTTLLSLRFIPWPLITRINKAFEST